MSKLAEALKAPKKDKEPTDRDALIASAADEVLAIAKTGDKKKVLKALRLLLGEDE